MSRAVLVIPMDLLLEALAVYAPAGAEFTQSIVVDRTWENGVETVVGIRIQVEHESFPGPSGCRLAEIGPLIETKKPVARERATKKARLVG